MPSPERNLLGAISSLNTTILQAATLTIAIYMEENGGTEQLLQDHKVSCRVRIQSVFLFVCFSFRDLL